MTAAFLLRIEAWEWRQRAGLEPNPADQERLARWDVEARALGGFLHFANLYE